MSDPPSFRQHLAPILRFGRPARAALHALFPDQDSLISDLEDAVDPYVPGPAFPIVTPAQIRSIRKAAAGLSNKLSAFHAKGTKYEDGAFFAIRAPDNADTKQTQRVVAEMVRLSDKDCHFETRREIRCCSKGIPVVARTKTYWLETPDAAVAQLVEDIDWLLGHLAVDRGRRPEHDRKHQAVSVARVLSSHGIALSTYDEGLLAHTLKIVLDDAGYAVPDDLRRLLRDVVAAVRE